MPSHVTILAAGTRGDVQPYIALALGLVDAGHDVTLAANAEFRAFVEAYGVPFRGLSVDYLALADTPEGRAALKGNPLTATRRMRDIAAPMVRRMLDDAWAAAQDTDAIVYHPKTLAGPHLSERLGVPAFVGAAVPMLSPTRAFPVPGLVKRSLGPLNRATYRLSTAAAKTFRGTVDAWREEVLDLPHAPHGVRDVAPDGSPLPKLYAYSEAVLPRPADWADDTTVTGYWDLAPAPGWSAGAELRRFLAAGPAPVYVGFGSMPLDGAERTAAEVVAALRAVGMRGLLGGALGAGAAADMHAVGDVPHAWLFEHVAAVVHHGGAGTTGAGLRAGRPTVIVPHAVDQPFWARAVEARGAAPRPLPPDKLDAKHLSVALTRALADPIAARAAELGRVLRSEDGVAVAAHHLSAAIHPSHRRTSHVHAI
jgi:sterol 3beta-glucosyltransferase